MTRPRLVALAITLAVLLVALLTTPARSVPTPTPAPVSGWTPVSAPRSTPETMAADGSLLGSTTSPQGAGSCLTGTQARALEPRDVAPAVCSPLDQAWSGASHLGDVSPAPVVALALAEPAQPTTAPAATSGDSGAVVPVVSPGRDGTLQGLASWFRYVPGQAAAGPRLRAVLGPGWRGTVVIVTANGFSVRTQLTDWCQCFEGTATERVIDLAAADFAQLAPLGLGLVAVEVRVA